MCQASFGALLVQHTSVVSRLDAFFAFDLAVIAWFGQMGTCSFVLLSRGRFNSAWLTCPVALAGFTREDLSVSAHARDRPFPAEG